MNEPPATPLAVAARVQIARWHIDSMIHHRFRFLRDRVIQRYPGWKGDVQQAAMVVAVDRYLAKHKR